MQTAESGFTLNMGDIIFQLFSLAIPIVLIIVILFLWTSSRKKKARLDRIEAKLDKLTEKNE
ncbi:DUF4083 domain-containing protein [Bacillus pinisoli]|uniref:DUF4083 domain-containing protein n=1 Tax=Bacillus pinisoli TaxID=2901866 RepID=UPI001FF158E8|nr:DUF4083 domain-containing protein [Bacillus pinisoli]